LRELPLEVRCVQLTPFGEVRMVLVEDEELE
jgi:hypothetical protein